MVPAMFQVPIRAPTANRMNTALIATDTPPTAASATERTVKPFLKAIRLANAALSSNATWSGPSVALTPNRVIVSASSPISTMIGRSASSRVGARGVRRRDALMTASWSRDHTHVTERSDVDSVVVLIATGVGQQADHQQSEQCHEHPGPDVLHHGLTQTGSRRIGQVMQ